MIVATAAIVGCGDIDESEKIPVPKYHTTSDEGLWTGQSATHVPVVTFTGPDRIQVRVPLNPARKPRHYIEAIVLLDGEREIAAKRFDFRLDEARAEFTLPDPTKGTYRVVAKCNLHDMWSAPVPARRDEQRKRR